MARNTKIQLKRTSVSGRFPNTSDPSNTQYIAAGELALNMADKILYTSDGTDAITVGATQVNFSATTITVSDTFAIGDINTSLLLANSSTIFAGNTNVNTTVNTALISVANSLGNSSINAQRIFVGNSQVNAQFNLVGGDATFSIDKFIYDPFTESATFTTTAPHGLPNNIKGTFATLSNMTGAAAVFDGRKEITNAPTANTFVLSNVLFGASIPKTYSVGFKSNTQGVTIATDSIILPEPNVFGMWETVVYTGTGAAIGGLVFGTTYYISNAVYTSTTTTIRLAKAIGGLDIDLTSAPTTNINHTLTGGSIRRQNGQAIVHTVANHGFPNGSVVIIKGTGTDRPTDINYGFDGTAITVVNTVAASKTLSYNQPENGIKTVSPTLVWKNANEKFFTFVTPTAHGLASEYSLQTVPYPPIKSLQYPLGAPTTPIVLQFLANGSNFTSKTNPTDTGIYGAGQAIYVKIDDVDFGKTLLTSVNQATRVETATSSSVTVNVSDIFTDPTQHKTAPVTGVVTPGASAIMVTSSDINLIKGDLILSGFSAGWGTVFNDKQVTVESINEVTYKAKTKSLNSPPAYAINRCFLVTYPVGATINQIPIRVSDLARQSGLTLATAILRTPKNLGFNSSSFSTRATKIYSSPYIIRLDAPARAVTTTDYQSTETSWGTYGAVNDSVDIDRFRNGSGLYVNVTGNWQMPYSSFQGARYGVVSGPSATGLAGVLLNNAVQPLVTINLGGASNYSVNSPPLTQFNVGDWIAIDTNVLGREYRSSGTGPQGCLQQVFGTGGWGVGFYQISAIDYSTRSITVFYNDNRFNMGFYGQPGGFGYRWTWWNGGNGNRDDNAISNSAFVRYMSIRKMHSSTIQLAATLTKPWSQPTSPTVINTTAFTIPDPDGALIAGSEAVPLTVLSGTFTRNTDVGAGGKQRSPLAPPSIITLAAASSTTGNLRIEYSSYVEVVNSSASIRVTPSTFYNGNSTVNLFSNSSTMVIGSQTDGLKLSPQEISIKGYSGGVYDPTQPYIFANSTFFHLGGAYSKYTEIVAGGILVRGSEFTVGTETANVYMNENYAIFSSDNAQTYISPLYAEFSGNVSLYGSMYVNGSYGDTGQYLSTDGKTLFWANGFDTDSQVSFTNTVSFSDVISSTSSFKFTENVDVDPVYSTVDATSLSYYTVAGETVKVTGNSITVSSDIADADTYGNSVFIDPRYISVGSPAVNTVINATSFTGTSNNTLYVGSVTAANVVSNAQLQANLANYQTTAGLSSNIANFSANNASYLGGILASQYAYVNSLSSYVNTSGSYTITGVHTHTANLIVNAAIIAGGGPGTAGQVLTSNGSGNVYWSTPVGGGTGLDVNAQYTWSNIQTFSNTIIVSRINANNSNGSAGQVLSSNGTGVYWAAVTGTGTVTSVATGNGLSGGPITDTGTISVLANTGIIANSYGLFVDSSYVVNTSQLSSNLSNYATTSSLSGYATTGSVTSNAATAYSNAIAYSGNAAQAYANSTTYVDNKSYVNTSQLSSNLSNYALKSGATFTGDLTTNNLTVSGNLTIAGNTTIINANNLVVSDAVISLHTQANLAPWTSSDARLVGTAYHYYNGEDKQGLLALDQSTGVLSYYEDSTDAINGDPSGTVLGTIRANTFTGNLIGTANNANNLNGQPASYYLSTSGSYGTNGQVLTSNGTGVYWATGASGGFSNGQSISVNNFLVTGAFTANSSNGLAGQVLTTNGAGLYWSQPATGQVSNITRQTYIANGSTNTFTVATGYIANNLDVFVNGVKLLTNVEANVQNGSTFTILAGTPLDGSVIEVAGLVGTPTVDYTKYVKTFNLVGNFSAQVVGTARYTPLSNTTLTTFRLTNSANIVGADLIAQISKNGVLDSSFTLPTGQYTQLYTNTSIYVTINDYLTVNITQGSGKDFSFTMSN